MVHSPDARGQPQPFRCVHGGRGIEDHRDRNDAGVHIALFQFFHAVGDAGAGIELTARQGGRHDDLADLRRLVVRKMPFAVLIHHCTERLQPRRLGNAVLQTDGCGLAAVRGRTAAEADQ